MIHEYIKDVCEMLNIEKPSISFDTSHFSSATMMAQCTNDTIYIRKIDKPTPDYLFAIAHELRHLWQMQNDEEYYFSNYKTVDKIGLENYNNQIAEVDAHAFASIVMVDCFHLQPQFHGLSAYTICLIKKRINEIASIF